MVSTQSVAKINRSWLKKNVPIKKFSNILAKTSENCFYVVNLYFQSSFSMPSSWRSYLTVRFHFVVFFCFNFTDVTFFSYNMLSQDTFMEQTVRITVRYFLLMKLNNILSPMCTHSRRHWIQERCTNRKRPPFSLCFRLFCTGSASARMWIYATFSRGYRSRCQYYS